MVCAYPLGFLFFNIEENVINTPWPGLQLAGRFKIAIQKNHSTIMLLKYVVLPLYTLLYGFFILRTLVLQDFPEAFMFGMFRPDKPSGVANDIATKAEIHLMHNLGAGLLPLVINSIVAICSGSPHDRTWATLMCLIFQVVDVASGQSLGLPPPYPLFGMMVLTVVAMALELGFFTKEGEKKMN